MATATLGGVLPAHFTWIIPFHLTEPQEGGSVAISVLWMVL